MLIGRPDFIFVATHHRQRIFFWIIYALVYWIVSPSILGPLVEEHDDKEQHPI